MIGTEVDGTEEKRLKEVRDVGLGRILGSFLVPESERTGGWAGVEGKFWATSRESSRSYTVGKRPYPDTVDQGSDEWGRS